VVISLHLRPSATRRHLLSSLHHSLASTYPVPHTHLNLSQQLLSFTLMDLLPKIRFALFALVLIFSLVELALCAKNITITNAGLFIDDGFEILMLSPFFFPFVAFGLAIAVMTLLFLIPIMVIDVLRKGAVTSMIAFELAWTGLFWILWLAVAADATAPGIFKNCNFEDDRVETICDQFPAIQGLAFFNWLLLLGWWVTLGVLAFNLRRRTNNPNLWRQSVADARISMAESRPSGGFMFRRGARSGGGVGTESYDVGDSAGSRKETVYEHFASPQKPTSAQLAHDRV